MLYTETPVYKSPPPRTGKSEMYIEWMYIEWHPPPLVWENLVTLIEVTSWPALTTRVEEFAETSHEITMSTLVVFLRAICPSNETLLFITLELWWCF